jgi:hypothetical protein
MVESGSGALTVQVLPGVDDDAERLDELTALLRDELLELDVASVEPVAAEQAPEDAKGVVGVVVGWLAVHFGPSGLKAVVNAVVAWAGRNQRAVELTLNGNTLKLTGANADVQARVVDEFFARLSPPT